MRRSIQMSLVPAMLAVMNSAVLAAAEGGAEPTVMPGPNVGLVSALTTLIIFIVLLVVLSKFAWGPIASGLKAREDKIRKDIENAEAAHAKAEATLKEYQAQLATAENKVRELLTKANADAEQMATSIRMRAQQEAEEAKERATKDIEAAKNQALSEIYAKTAELATDVASKILRRNLNAADQADLVKSSLDQLGKVSSN